MKLERIVYVSISSVSLEVVKQRLNGLSGKVLKGIFLNLDFLENRS